VHVTIYSKLNSLGYMVHSLRPVLGLKTIKQIYFSYLHSVLNYGIIFWGNSPHRSIFITQKRIVRMIMKAKAKDSCREMFSKLGILTLYSQYTSIFSILMFVVKHKDIFTTNAELHNINTCQKLDFHVLVLHYLTPYPSISRKLHITLNLLITPQYRGSCT
jgi:hypothetical protein